MRQSSATLSTRFMTYRTCFVPIPGNARSKSSARVFTSSSSVPPALPSSTPKEIALATSGSAKFALSSRTISADAYGDDDQIIRSRGNDSVRRTSFDWTRFSFAFDPRGAGPPSFSLTFFLGPGFASASVWNRCSIEGSLKQSITDLKGE